jgi:hypothetical protein
VTDQLESLRELRHVLVRLGARQAGRYWSAAPLVFASNLLGGAAAGAAASIIAAVLLAFDAHRGSDSFLYHALQSTAAIVNTIRVLIDKEVR